MCVYLVSFTRCTTVLTSTAARKQPVLATSSYLRVARTHSLATLTTLDPSGLQKESKNASYNTLMFTLQHCSWCIKCIVPVLHKWHVLWHWLQQDKPKPCYASRRLWYRLHHRSRLLDLEKQVSTILNLFSVSPLFPTVGVSTGETKDTCIWPGIRTTCVALLLQQPTPK